MTAAPLRYVPDSLRAQPLLGREDEVVPERENVSIAACAPEHAPATVVGLTCLTACWGGGGTVGARLDLALLLEELGHAGNDHLLHLRQSLADRTDRW
jgi:hypothetical protein